MQEGQYHATKRVYAIVPDSDGDSTDAYTYSGNFKSRGKLEKIKVQTADNWQTVTIAEQK